jgi:hypothetical protein
MTRHPLILAALAGVLTLAACGGDPASSAKDPDTAFEGALKFAKCMREHGVDVPDPKQDAGGGVRLTLKSGRNGQGSPAKVEAAQKACGKYMKAGGGKRPDAATQARMQDAQLAFARCMRRHGMDMPDPVFTKDGGSVTRMRKGKDGGVSPESPVFKKAEAACEHLLDAARRDQHGDDR